MLAKGNESKIAEVLDKLDDNQSRWVVICKIVEVKVDSNDVLTKQSATRLGKIGYYKGYGMYTSKRIAQEVIDNLA